MEGFHPARLSGPPEVRKNGRDDLLLWFRLLSKLVGFGPVTKLCSSLKDCLAPRKGCCWIPYCTDVVSEERTEMGARCARRIIIISSIINSGSGEHQHHGIVHRGGAGLMGRMMEMGKIVKKGVKWVNGEKWVKW